MASTNGNGRNGAAVGVAPATPPAAMMGPAVTLPEAPVSLTMRAPYRGRELMITVRGAVDSAVFERLDAVISWLDAFAPAESAPTVPVPAAAPAPVPTADQPAPTCPTHGTPMRPGNRGGWYCPRVIAPDDGTGRGKPAYCKSRIAPGGTA